MQGLAAAVRARMHSLRYGFLFLPGLVALAVGGLAPLLVWLDRSGGAGGPGIGYQAEPDAARAVLATIAGSLITVAGLTFSITIVSLQLVSQQFSPRALRGFLGDRLNQTVAGAFIGTFIYCILVLRTVTQGADGATDFVPGLSISVSVALAVASIALLLVFIHHMSHTIQVSAIAAGISDATLSTLEPLYADEFGTPTGDDPDTLVTEWSQHVSPQQVYPPRPGYLQSVAFEDLDRQDAARGIRASLRAAPGDFVTQTDVLLEYWAPDVKPELESLVHRLTIVQSERDLHQDADFGLRQLADIALKAISPGVNDPTTAVTCVGYLRAILERLAALETPAPVRRYERSDTTLIARARPFDEYLNTAFVELGRFGSADARIAEALLVALAAIARATASAGFAERLDALARTAADIAAQARADARTATDEQRIDRSHRRVLAACAGER